MLKFAEDLLIIWNSLLHLYCFWKQLVTYYKIAWLRTLPHGPCARCGFSVSSVDVLRSHLPFRQEREYRRQPVGTTRAPASPARPNLCTYAGPSATLHDESALTPQTTDSAMEEGLLVSSDYGGGYGAVETANEQEDIVVQEPREVVVQKLERTKSSPAAAGPSEKALGKRAMQ